MLSGTGNGYPGAYALTACLSYAVWEVASVVDRSDGPLNHVLRVKSYRFWYTWNRWRLASVT